MLKELHELWYKINGLEEKYSDVAERYKERYRAEFFTLAPKVVDDILLGFTIWAEDHTYDGWWIKFRPEVLDSGGIFKLWQGYIDARPCVKSKIEEYTGEEVKGEYWWYKNIRLVTEVLDDCQKEIWDQWVNHWPDYIKTLEDVKVKINELQSVRDSNDVNQIMQTVSLALNTAHNSGLMYEHMGMKKEEMDELSNLDTSEWDQQLARFAKHEI